MIDIKIGDGTKTINDLIVVLLEKGHIDPRYNGNKYHITDDSIRITFMGEPNVRLVKELEKIGLKVTARGKEVTKDGIRYIEYTPERKRLVYVKTVKHPDWFGEITVNSDKKCEDQEIEIKAEILKRVMNVNSRKRVDISFGDFGEVEVKYCGINLDIDALYIEGQMYHVRELNRNKCDEDMLY